jgi:hypothetical protein
LDDLKEEGEEKSMYATVRRYEGVTDPAETTRRVNEGFIQLVSRIPGFVAYYRIDAGAGVMISASVFENQASAEDSNKKAADYVRENLVSVLPNPLKLQPERSSRTRQDSDPPR